MAVSRGRTCVATVVTAARVIVVWSWHLTESKEECNSLTLQSSGVLKEQDLLNQLEVEIEHVDRALLEFDVLDQLVQEELADLDISPRQMRDNVQNGLPLPLSWLVSRLKNLLHAFWGQESRDVLVWEMDLLGLLLIVGRSWVATQHRDSFCQTTSYQVCEELKSTLKIWLLNSVSHPVICTTLAVVKGWSIVHHEFK